MLMKAGGRIMSAADYEGVCASTADGVCRWRSCRSVADDPRLQRCAGGRCHL